MFQIRQNDLEIYIYLVSLLRIGLHNSLKNVRTGQILNYYSCLGNAKQDIINIFAFRTADENDAKVQQLPFEFRIEYIPATNIQFHF